MTKNKMIMKKILFLLVTVLLPMVACAYDFSIDGIYYNFLVDDDYSVGVAGCENSLKEVNIPMRVYYGGGWLKVKEICKNAFYHNETYQRSYVLPNSIEIIREYAFAGNDIYDITLPSSLKTIERGAFSTTPIIVVKIPASVEVIGDYAFGGTWDTCPDAEDYCWARYPQKYEVDAGNQYYSSVDGLLYDKEQTKLINYPDGLGAATIHIPATVKEFKNAGTPKKIIVNSKTWYELDKGEFPHFIVREYDDDGNLISGPTHIIYDGDKPLGPVNGEVIVPEGVECIGENMFYLSSYYSDEVIYSDIKSVSLPSSLKKIGRLAFGNCKGMETINIPNSVTSIGKGAFENCSGLTSINIPTNLTTIDQGVFKGCSGLTSICISNRVTSIGSQAFYNCSGLNSIVVESENAVYDSRENCNAIIETASNKLILGCSSSIIPKDVTCIGYGAFAGCKNLASIVIPQSVTSIESNAFGYCANLKSVTMVSAIPISISNDAFYASTSAVLYVPKGSKEAYASADVWKDFSEIVEYNTQCATPTITVKDGKLSFACETEGVEYHYSITSVATGLGNNADVLQDMTYTVTVYATKEDHIDSNVATTTVNIPKGDVNADGVVSIADAVSVVNIILNESAAAPAMEEPEELDDETTPE